MENIVGIVFIVEGLVLFLADFLAFVYRKLTEEIALGWGFLSVFLILLGVLPIFSDWFCLIPREALPALGLIQLLGLAACFRASIYISVLLRKNQELAMHVSLLNQENERILKQLKDLMNAEEKRDK